MEPEPKINNFGYAKLTALKNLKSLKNLNIKAKITLGFLKSNMFYSRVGVGAGAETGAGQKILLRLNPSGSGNYAENGRL